MRQTIPESESFKAMLADIGDWAEKKDILAIILCLRPDGMMEAVANDECGFNIGLTSWMTTMDDTYGEGTSDKLELIPIILRERYCLYVFLLRTVCK